MTEELTKRENPQLDGFDAYDDSIEGESEQGQGRGVIQGACIKFTNEAAWVTRDGAELSPNLELMVVDIGRIVQKWHDQQPVETIILGPGQKYPDLKKLNDETPRGEWVKGPDGQPRGPWQAQHIVYLLDEATMDRYSFPTGTTGGSIAVRELVDKCLWMRRYRGTHVYPVVVLSDKFMNTRFGGRQRPNFIIRRWVLLGAGGQQTLPAEPPKSLPTPTTVQGTFDAFATSPPTQPKTAAPAKAKTVSEPLLAEEMNDSLEDLLQPTANVPPAKPAARAKAASKGGQWSI
jgi:hypothetical protein